MLYTDDNSGPSRKESRVLSGRFWNLKHACEAIFVRSSPRDINTIGGVKFGAMFLDVGECGEC